MLFVPISSRLSLLLSLSCAISASAAAAEPSPIQTVAISASRDLAGLGNELRQDDSTLRSVFGREELQKYADSTLTEVLKRLPGVSVTDTPGKGVQIRMRGLGNGYTQILLNGEATPPGYALNEIAPELIERIEVLRVAGADISAQGIAGSINIVLRKKTEKNQREVKLGLATQGRQWMPSLSLNFSDNSGALAYGLAAAFDSSRRDQSDIYHETHARSQDGQMQLVSARQLNEATQKRKGNFSLSPRLSWKMNPGQSLLWQSFANLTQQENRVHEQEQNEFGISTDFPMNNSIWAAQVTTWRNDWTWETRLADSAKLGITAGWNYFRRDSKFDFWGRDAQATLLNQRFVQADADENEAKFNGKYLAPYIDGHVLSFGWESSRAQRHELRFERETRMADLHSTDTLHLYDARLDKLALFAQDEWSLRPDLSAYLGLRWERILNHSSGDSGQSGAYSLKNSVSMFSPILQTVWKLGDKKQIRLALNRSFKAPAAANLIPRLFRIDNNNNPLNPDRQGTPALRPEKAWGGDLAYEAFLAQGGVLSASVYLRKIQDMNREILTQNGNSWLITPVNDGTALARGIELEAKFDLQQLASSLPKLGVRASLTRNWSSVQKVPAPDNRMAGQIAMSANLGLDYQLNPQVSLGGDFSFQGANALRKSNYLSAQIGPSRQLDLYASWHLDSQSQLRLAVSNLLKQSASENELYQDPQERWRVLSNTPGQTLWRLVWEQRF